jgi:phage antirepressor YoqD-like protein
MIKPVIMMWIKTDSGTHPNGSIKSYGLGDLLRGTIYLHQMSVRHGFKLIVDLSMNPISKHLIVHKHEHAQYVNANIKKIHIVNCHELNKFDVIYNASLINPEPLLICTNMFCDEHLSVESKQFMKTLLTPNEQFSTYLNEQNALHNISAPYSIMHIRLHDDEFFKNKSVNNSHMNDAIKIIKQHTLTGDILMSNSHRFKEHVKSLHGRDSIAMLNTHPLHLGDLSTVFHDNIAKSFKETLYEFFVLGNASSIKTYSVYEWVSGFVKFASVIHDVPLIDLKQRQSITHRENRYDTVVSPASNKSVLTMDSIRFKPTILINRSHATLNRFPTLNDQNLMFGIKH